ncbi:hypothetical protein DFH28DRAFT_925262 [Melampsora americana]|nr:hypothetical protein DFH28DRAFT_925262 [Melampsora americana]
MATRSCFKTIFTSPFSQTLQSRTISSSNALWHTALAKQIRESAREKIKVIDQGINDNLQDPKVSSNLIDPFGRKHTYLRISLTELCNLRCQYCMPQNGIPTSQLTPNSKLMTTSELFKITELLLRHGIHKIRFTGGEPSLRSDLTEIIHHLHQFPTLQSIGITTNGILLKRRLKPFIQAGLTHLNLSLDTLDPLKFELITRRKGHHLVLDSLDQALDHLEDPTKLNDHSSGLRHLTSVKLNVVVIRGLNDDEILDFVSLTEKKAVQIRFIEYMPFKGNAWSNKKMVPYSEMLDSIKSRYPDLITLESDLNDTTKHYQVPGFKGQIGFISSMSDHFCGGCNRLRLGADGQLKVCLFGPPNLSILPYLRNTDQPINDDQLMNLIGQALKGKHFKHAGHQKVQLSSTSSPKTLPTILFHEARDVGEARNDIDTSYKSYLSRHPARIQSQIHHTTRYQSSGLALLPEIHRSSRMMLGSSNPLMSLIPVHRPYHSPSEKLTHIDHHTGNPKMVDVSSKKVTERSSKAIGFVIVPERIRSLLDPNWKRDDPKELKMKETGIHSKGNPLIVAQIAGLQAIKRTSELIPLCHNSIPLSHQEIKIELIESQPDDLELKIQVESEVKGEGKTGIEMEALMGVSMSCLTLWDMLKGVCGEEMRIEKIRVMEKRGGKKEICLKD